MRRTAWLAVLLALCAAARSVADEAPAPTGSPAVAALSETADGARSETPDAAKKTCIELAAAWSLVVDALLSLVVTRVPPDKVADLLSQDGIVDTVANDVNGLAYAGRKQLPFDEFGKLVSPNG